MEQRYLQMHDIQTRNDGEDGLFIEGYFSVFNEIYNVWPGATESIRKGAFTEALKTDDVRALYNHNTDLVLGRLSAGTLELKQDDRGLWGRIKVNRNDTDAMNAYERIARGDITGCSFGFDIEEQIETISDDGSVHFELTKISPLYEVSPCVFPAYEATHIEARAKDVERIKERMHDAWKMRMMNKLKGNSENGIKSIDDKEEAGSEEE